MNAQRTFTEELKHQFYYGGMTVKLIFINLLVFLFIGIASVLGGLMQGEFKSFIEEFNTTIFALDTNISEVIVKPWGLITSIFAHFSFMHLFFNMLMLFFVGKAFEQLFSQKRLLYTYILGGLLGGVFEILAHTFFPLFAHEAKTVIVGASGSVMAIFIALAFYRPSTEVNLFGIFPIKLIYLACIYLAMNLFSLAKPDGTAHFAHIGGAVLGILSIQKINSSYNIISLFDKLIESIKNLFTRSKRKKKPTFTIHKGGSARGGVKTDEEFNFEKKQRQEKIDAILDKIAKSGYESLSKAEKEFLFIQSQDGK
jgi:membrane associated rhomboid family serine protease